MMFCTDPMTAQMATKNMTTPTAFIRCSTGPRGLKICVRGVDGGEARHGGGDRLGGQPARQRGRRRCLGNTSAVALARVPRALLPRCREEQWPGRPQGRARGRTRAARAHHGIHHEGEEDGERPVGDGAHQAHNGVEEGLACGGRGAGASGAWCGSWGGAGLHVRRQRPPARLAPPRSPPRRRRWCTAARRWSG